jgi:nicotinate-nucleotide adenylyltransferase
MKNSIGIYSGTFDPIHNGHIAFCLEAISTGGLDKVIILPEETPRAKHNVTDMAHRVAMLERAVRPFPQLEVMQLDLAQFCVGGTLPELQRRFPDAELTLLVGSDVVETFAYRWPGLEKLLAAMSLAIGLRDNDTAEEVADLIAQLEHEYSIAIRYKILPSPHEHLASSDVRQGSHTITDISPEVGDYIKTHKLYA